MLYNYSAQSRRWAKQGFRGAPLLACAAGGLCKASRGGTALLINDYCSNLTLYKLLANCDAEDNLWAMQEELVDRYGEMPPQTQALVETHRLRLLGKPLGIAKLDAGPNTIQLQFTPAPIDPLVIIKLIQSDRSFKLAGQDKLTWQKATGTLKDRVGAVKELFKRLGG